MSTSAIKLLISKYPSCTIATLITDLHQRNNLSHLSYYNITNYNIPFSHLTSKEFTSVYFSYKPVVRDIGIHRSP